MCILPEIVTENSVNVLRMENYTKITMGYGEVFSMEYFYENNWKKIEFGCTIILVHLNTI
jgi:hypothetical protein